MKEIRIVLIALVLAVALPLTVNLTNKMTQGKVSQESSKIIENPVLPSIAQAAKLQDAIKVEAGTKVITLEKANTVVLRGPVMGSSVAKAMKELRSMSRVVSKETPIYLVLDTPGGSIMDGMDLIEFAKALPQKVHTVTLFAASMGFQIAQNLDTRYIARDGTLMSHRARIEGLGGQVKGELETRYQNVRRVVDYLDTVASTRMSKSLQDYESMILNEYWVFGFDAVSAKAADEQVMIRCGDTMEGTETLQFQTLFGNVSVVFDSCPLIKEPQSINMDGLSFEHRKEAEEAVRESLVNKVEFVKDFIMTGKFETIFR